MSINGLVGKQILCICNSISNQEKEWNSHINNMAKFWEDYVKYMSGTDRQICVLATFPLMTKY